MEKYKEVQIICPNCKREIKFAIMEEKMEKRKIEVVKLGEKTASGINDRVSVEFSPHELEAMKQIFMERAINAETYVGQTVEREMYEAFDEALDMWKEKRKEGDAKEGYAV